MSALLPTETKVEMPMPRATAKATAEIPRAPLWDMKPTPPEGGSGIAKVALS